MLKRAVLICDQNTIAVLYLLLNALSEPVEILKIYGVGSVVYQDIPISDIQDLPEIRELQADFIINENCVQENIFHILKQMGYEPDQNVYSLKSFLSHCVTPLEEMRFVREKIRMIYPANRNENNRIIVGDFTYGSPYVLNDVENVWCRIGKFCSIAENVAILPGADHHVDWVSTYPFNVFVEGMSGIEGHPTSKGDVVIGNDVWIGYGSTILSGVEIGDGAVIASGSVVTRSIPPYSIAAGVPAQMMRKRFDDDLVEKLLEMRWWDWPYEQIYEVIPLLQNDHVEELITYWREKDHAG